VTRIVSQRRDRVWSLSAGLIIDEAGDTDILWSEKPTGPGHDGVPTNIVKIDITTEPNTTMALEELVARRSGSSPTVMARSCWKKPLRCPAD
jgi:hypothetical protein